MILPKSNDFHPKARLVKLDRDDKPPPNPFDTAPATPLEAVHELKVRAALRGCTDAMRRVLRSLTVEQFGTLRRAAPHLEGELPEIDDIRHGLFFFSVNGELDGRKIRRCLLAGECMLISAASPHEARQLAQEGLEQTIRHTHTYANSMLWGVPLTQENPGIAIESRMPIRK